MYANVPAEEVLPCVRLWYYFSSILGVCPSKITNVSGVASLRFSLWGNVYSLVLLAFPFLCLSVVSAHYVFKVNTDMSKALLNIQYYMEIVVSVFIIVSACINQRKVIAHWNRLIDAIETMKKEGMALNFSFLKILHHVQLLYVVLHFAAGVTLNYAASCKDGQSDALSCIRIVCYSVASSVIMFMEYHYINQALVLRKTFTSLNAAIQDLAGVKVDVNKKRYKIYPATIDAFSVSKTKMDPVTLIEKLKTFRRIHDTLCDVCYTLNSIFSLQVLMTAGNMFCSLTINLFHSCRLLILYYKENAGSFDVIMFLNAFFSAIFSSVVTLLLAAACSVASSQANRTGGLVHQLRRLAEDVEVDTEVEAFLLQLHHRKVYFTAFDFFRLDFTFVHSVISAVTTYLIILIQFQLMK